jgi:hypothetical protein
LNSNRLFLSFAGGRVGSYLYLLNRVTTSMTLAKLWCGQRDNVRNINTTIYVYEHHMLFT